MQASAGAEEQLQKLQLELSEAARLRDTYQADAEKQRRRWKRLGSGSGLGGRWLLCGGLCPACESGDGRWAGGGLRGGLGVDFEGLTAKAAVEGMAATVAVAVAVELGPAEGRGWGAARLWSSRSRAAEGRQLRQPRSSPWARGLG